MLSIYIALKRLYDRILITSIQLWDEEKAISSIYNYLVCCSRLWIRNTIFGLLYLTIIMSQIWSNGISVVTDYLGRFFSFLKADFRFWLYRFMIFTFDFDNRVISFVVSFRFSDDLIKINFQGIIRNRNRMVESFSKWYVIYNLSFHSTFQWFSWIGLLDKSKGSVNSFGY